MCIRMNERGLFRDYFDKLVIAVEPSSRKPL